MPCTTSYNHKLNNDKITKIFLIIFCSYNIWLQYLALHSTYFVKVARACFLFPSQTTGAVVLWYLISCAVYFIFIWISGVLLFCVSFFHLISCRVLCEPRPFWPLQVSCGSVTADASVVKIAASIQHPNKSAS